MATCLVASSISSKHPFSGSVITITKWHNHSKGDIVEALQVIKCAPRTELLVHKPAPNTTTEFTILNNEETTDPASEDVTELDGDDEWHMDGSVDEEGDL